MDSLSKDQRSRIKEQLNTLFNSTVDWPEYDQEAKKYQRKKIKVGDLINNEDLLKAPKAPVYQFYHACASKCLRDFREENPHIDISEITKFVNGGYPKREGLERKEIRILQTIYKNKKEIEKIISENDSRKLQELENLEKKLENQYGAVKKDIGDLPSREDALIKLISGLEGQESNLNLILFIEFERHSDQTYGDEVAIKRFARRLNTLNNLVGLEAPDVVVKNHIRLVKESANEMEEALKKSENFAYDKKQLSKIDQVLAKRIGETESMVAQTFRDIQINAGKILGFDTHNQSTSSQRGKS